jgi:ABC-type multidrug transport system permease subunit
MIRMALHQSGYDLRAFLRNRQSQFFTLALPVLFLVIFASVFGSRGQTVPVAGGRISTSVSYVPGIIALGVIAACFGNLVAAVTSFCCLGYALTSLIRNEDTALPTTQALLLPLYFISGVFVTVTILPHWLADVGEIFPVRHLADALLTAYNPHTAGLGFAGPDLLIVAAWGAAGLLIALRTFSWQPLGR